MSTALAPAKEAALQHKKIDELENIIFNSGQAILDLPLVHRFTKGMYIREIFMPAGITLTTRIHKTQHPFVLLSGTVSVYIPEGGAVTLTGPHIGITEPGTRRVLYMHTDARWITFHVNEDDETDPDVIVERVTDHPGLPEGIETRSQYLDVVESSLQPQLDYGGAP